MDTLLAVLGIATMLALPVLIAVFLAKLKRARLDEALAKYAMENGVELRVEHTGTPPARYWLDKRKGDIWAKVAYRDGTRKWVRLRGTMLLGGNALTFFDA